MFVDTKKFISDCIGHHSNRQLQLSPRLLERTKVVRVENLPPGVDDYQLQLYFESPFTGGGRVTHVECFPEESSALVEFSDSKGNVSWPAKPGMTWMAGHFSHSLICQKWHQSLIHLDLVQDEGSKAGSGEAAQAHERQGESLRSPACD